jgi:transcriptional regulator with GAF, ATPase, and Fis domain
MPKKINQAKKQAKQPEKLKQNAFHALTAICGILVSGTSLEESLARIAAITSETMNAKSCSVMIYDRENQELSVKASTGANQDKKNIISLKSGNSLYGFAMQEKQTMTSGDMAKAGRPILPGTAEFSDISSMISAPMMYGNEPIGVINACGNENHVFTQDEKITMQAIADQSAAAIQLAKFSEEALEAKEALKERKIIDKAKGILMKQRNMSEEQAYRAMRSKSMDSSKPMKEVAEAIILTNEIRLQF